MSIYRTILTALLALAPAIQSTTPPAKSALAAVRGVVVDAASNLPVNGAVVELSGVKGGQVLSYTDVTSKDGKFELLDVQPGSGYQLVASDTGNYRTGAFGQHTPNDPWTPVTLASGQNLAGVRMLLTPISSINGRVTDASGKGVGKAQVFALRATYSAGRRTLQLARQALAADNGEYFIGGLESGQYFIRTNPPNNKEEFRQLFENPAAWDLLINKKDGEPEGYPSFYYPGTIELDAARSVDLLNGGKAKDVNIRISKIRTHRVTGTVLAASRDDSAAEPAQKARLLLVPARAGSESSLTRWVNADNDGQFDFRGVFPGSYFLTAIASGTPSQLVGRKPVEIRDADLSNLSITVTRGLDIPGTIRFRDWQLGMPPDYSQLAINIVADVTAPVDRSLRGYRMTQTPLTVIPSASGQFSLRGLPPGDYIIIITLNPRLAADTKLPLDLKAAYMASVKLGDTDVLTNGMHLDGSAVGSLFIEVATNSGSIFGRVLDDNHEPVVPARMVIAPEKALSKRLDLYFQIAVSPTGRFNMDGIPPGQYRLFAWAHVEDGAWLDPNFMRVYEDKATPVKIEESGAHPIEVPLIH